MCPFSQPRFYGSSTTNATNRAGLTERHSLGSRSLAIVPHEVTSSDTVDNSFVYMSQKAYLSRIDAHERVRDESRRMLAQITREQYPNLAETDLNFTMSRIDQADLYIRARVWGTIYPSKDSRFRTPMMVAEGHRLLKDTRGFQRSRRGDAERAF